MITPQQAFKIAENYLKEKKRVFTSINSVEEIEKFGLFKEMEILYGVKEGQFIDTYVVGYGAPWGMDARAMGIRIDANTGEVLYTMGPHGPIEELEE